MDVPCWVSELASTYDLHYDQRRNACWWMTGDSGQTGERGRRGEMEEGQQMESGVEGERNVEVEKQMDQVEETGGGEMEEWMK